MTTTGYADCTVSEQVCNVTTRAAGGDQLATRNNLEQSKEGWQRIINSFLCVWCENPSILEDDEFVPPSAAVIHRAIDVARDFREKGLAPPLRVVPDGDGGLSFERREGNLSQSLDVLKDGTVELLTFVDCKLVNRQLLA